MPDSPGSDVNMGIIRKAMALRVKYRVASATGAKKRRIPLALMGVHNMNRGGVYPNGERVANLAVELLKVGFSEEEANHEGVCVQEVPASERTDKHITCAQYNALGCAQPALKARSGHRARHTGTRPPLACIVRSSNGSHMGAARRLEKTVGPEWRNRFRRGRGV